MLNIICHRQMSELFKFKLIGVRNRKSKLTFHYCEILDIHTEF